MTIRPISLASVRPEEAPSSASGEDERLRSEPKSDLHVRASVTTMNEVGNPADWPGPGPIDLSIHDLPHASSTLEWWYVNSHVVTNDGRHLSFFAAFFRQAKRRNQDTGAFDYAHSVTWALVDVERKEYSFVSGVDPSAPEEGLKRLRRGLGSKDPRLNRALSELLARGNVPSRTSSSRGECSSVIDGSISTTAEPPTASKTTARITCACTTPSATSGSTSSSSR